MLYGLLWPNDFACYYLEERKYEWDRWHHGPKQDSDLFGVVAGGDTMNSFLSAFTAFKNAAWSLRDKQAPILNRLIEMNARIIARNIRMRKESKCRGMDENARKLVFGW